MQRIISHFLFISFFIFSVHGDVSTEDEILNSPNNPLSALYGFPETNVHGVNVINGDYNYSVVDFVLPGSNSMCLQRSYSTSSNQIRAFFHGWTHNIFSVILKQGSGEHSKAVSQGSISGEIPYTVKNNQRSDSKPHQCRFNLKVLEKGISNCGQGEISGRTNIKNSMIDLKQCDQDVLTQSNGDGSTHTHRRGHCKDGNEYFYIEKTFKPNGCTVSYEAEDCFLRGATHHDWLGNATQKISSDIPTFSVLDQWVFQKNDFSFSVFSNDGRNIKYHFRTYPYHVKTKRKKGSKIKVKDSKTICLKKIESVHVPDEQYSYTEQNGKQRNKLTEKRGASHCTQIQYYAKGDEMHLMGTPVKVDSKDHIAYERVKQINVAVNSLDQPERLCWFSYSKHKQTKEAITDAYNEYNYLTRYVYSTKDYRLRTIERFNGTGPYGLYRREKMSWGESGSVDDSNLITRTIEDGDGNIHFAEHFTYDKKGNVITKKHFFRRATSLAEHSITRNDNTVNGGEVKCIHSKYNGLNLPIREDDGRLITETSYLSRYHQTQQKNVKSSLIQKKLQSDNCSVLTREFFDYDQAAGCTLHIVDDGAGTDLNDLSGVQQRKITRQVNKSGLFAGLPIEIATSGWDSKLQQERLIQRSEIDYDGHGHVCSQRQFDSENSHAFSIHKACDIQGNVIYETNPLGQSTSRVYDKYCCLLREQGPSPSFFTEYGYDFLQRPIKSTQVYSDGLRLSTYTSYNLQGKPTKEVGIYGQTTTKTYNEQNLVKTLIEAPVRTGPSEWRSTITQNSYDFMGNIATVTNLVNAKTIYEHTTDGKPLSIQHPDGRTEFFQYSIYGELIAKTAPNGAVTTYSYDSLGRKLSEVTLDKAGNTLKSHSFQYSGSLLVLEKDGDLTTTYDYDHAGRITRKCVGGGLTEYTYDTLGRQIQEKVYFGEGANDYISHKKSYDLLNRVIEEQISDSTGKIHTQNTKTYDELGNITSISEANHAGTATTIKKYDPRGNLCEETDPQGNTTYFIHRYDFVFEGQNLPCVETIDSTGVKKVTVSDYHGHVISEKIYSPFGELLSDVDMIYDVFGNLVKKEYRLPKETITTLYYYDFCHRLFRQVNGAGTLEQITTTFIYNSFGELAETQYSDGTSKHHSYDGLGRLQGEWSSDQSIHYRYTYNQQDLPIIIENCITGSKTVREYTVEGNLNSEQLENGLKISFHYDRMNRVTDTIYPDGTSVRKTYNPVFLAKTERLKNGTVNYEALFVDFDLTGLPKTIQFPKNSGTLSLEYDLLSRPIDVTYPHYQEKEICYDSRGLLVSKIVNNEFQKFDHDHLQQLTLENSSIYSHTYENDALNRQTTVAGLEQSYNAVNQLTHGIYGEYNFDAKGRRIRDSAIQFIYDKFDRLIEINRSDSTWIFTYDAFNRKMSRTLNGTTCQYLYDGTEEIGSYDVDGNNLDLKVLSSDEGSIPIAIEIAQQCYAPLISTQGHVVGLVDINDGSLANESPLTMFGVDLAESPLSPWRFCGKRHETAILGIVDFGCRYYHPRSAQWMTQDPIGESDGPNLYAYVHNNPTRCIDRYGLFMDDFSFSQSWGSFQTSMKGICHGIVDYAVESAWDLQRAAFYIGSNQSEFDYNERNELTNHFNQMESDQRVELETSLKNCLAVNESNEGHDTVRHCTTTGLAITSLAYGGFKGVQALYNLGKNLYQGYKLASTLPKLLSASKGSTNINRATSFAGSRRAPLDYAPYQKIRNESTFINGRKYSGHALDRMQDRGIMPSFVENTINTGNVSPTDLPGRFAHHDPVNKIRVIVGEKGQIITVIPGRG